MSTYLITGGCGFIGISLVKKLLLGRSSKIIILDNLSVGSRKSLSGVCDYAEYTSVEAQTKLAGANNTCSLIVGDILDKELVRLLVQRADCIVHLAGNTGVLPSIDKPAFDFESNVIGTFNILEAIRCRNNVKFVFASSGAPLGEVRSLPIHEELPTHPVSPYGASKLACEGYCSAFFHSFGIQAVALRFGNVYGPGSLHKNSVVAKFIGSALQNKSLEIYGDGQQTRDFIYIDDLVDAILLACSKANIGGEIFQIATNRESTILELLEKMQECFNDLELGRIEFKHSESLNGEVRRNFSSIDKATEKLQWRPKVDLKEGLRKTIEYFQKKDMLGELDG